jgi:hypothetical protein
MATHRQVVQDALNRVQVANVALRTQLEENDRLASKAQGLLTGGTSVSDTLSGLPVSISQDAADVAMTNLLAARQHLRKAVIHAASSEGMTIEELALHFNVRPDLVATYLADLVDGS